jgi:hypothetical protein
MSSLSRCSRSSARRLQPRLEVLLEGVELRARLAARLRLQLAQRLEKGGDRPGLAAEKAIAHRLQSRDVRGRRQRRLEVPSQRRHGLLQ